MWLLRGYAILPSMEIVLHPHATERLAERGVSREEAITTVVKGERFPAKFGRMGFRHHVPYGKTWRGKAYATKQVEVVAVEEVGHWLVITVIARYF